MCEEGERVEKERGGAEKEIGGGIKVPYTFPGPFIIEHPSDVQYSDIAPYIRLTWLKKEITEKAKKNKMLFNANIHPST